VLLSRGTSDKTTGVITSTEKPYTQKPVNLSICADIVDSPFRDSKDEASRLLGTLTDACQGLDITILV
jgi:hypothetical protein